MERDKSLDILRAFAILLVIFGHITHVWALKQYIWGFHMPLFFFVSGFLFNQEKYSSVKELLKAKINALVIPYVFFGLVTLVYGTVIESHFRAGGGGAWYMGLLGIIYGNCCSYMFFNMALWFIPCLFSMELFYWFICKMNHSWQIVVALISLNVLGIIAVKYLYWLPWGVNAAMVGMIFFGLGNLIKSNKDFIANVKWYYWMLTVGGMSILQYLMYDCSDSDLACLKFVNPILYVPIAFIGIALYFSIAKVIKKNCLLEWIGRNTFVLFAFQEPVFRAVIYSVAKIMQVDVEMVRMNVYLCVLCTILTIIVIAPLIVVYNKCIRKLLNKIAV